jgi:hypothetical protein
LKSSSSTGCGTDVRVKGRRAIGYQLLLILFWFGAEFGSAFVAAVLLTLVYGKEAEQCILLAYVAAFIGGGVGAWLAFRVVASLPDLQGEESPGAAS